MSGEAFLEAIERVPGVLAGWRGRVEGVAVEVERDEAMRRLLGDHRAWARERWGVEDWWRAEQVHGVGVAVVPGAETVAAADGTRVVPGVDGLVTNRAGVWLGIYVADCGPIWLADRKTGAVGLLHSGKKGTEGGILERGIERMGEAFGTRAEDLVVVLGPCIRPPHYEVDFAAEIERQAERARVGEYVDCGVDTARDPQGLYSYRMEKGRTGRMLALIGRKE